MRLQSELGALRRELLESVHEAGELRGQVKSLRRFIESQNASLDVEVEANDEDSKESTKRRRVSKKKGEVSPMAVVETEALALRVVDDANEYIGRYFLRNRCDCVGLDALLASAPETMDAGDILRALAARVVDTPQRAASHMVVVHEI
jgi:hypothetical protein